MEGVQLSETGGVEEVLALVGQIVVHYALDDVHLLVLLLLNFVTDCVVEVLYRRFYVDQLFFYVLVMFVGDLCTLLLKFLLVLSKKSTGDRTWSSLVPAQEARVEADHQAWVIQLRSCQLDRIEL